MYSERKFIIGIIVSTEFNNRIQGKWNIKLLESGTAKRLAMWVAEFYDKWHKAPGREIEGIFYNKQANLPKEIAEEIELEILPSLSKEYERETEPWNIDVLEAQTLDYFNRQNLKRFAQSIEAKLAVNDVNGATKIAQTYKPIVKDLNEWIDLSDSRALDDIQTIFEDKKIPLITFPGALGEFWNDSFYKGAFVALLAPEKRGKTWWMLEFAMQAAKNHHNVAFFQAGDMTKNEQLLRVWIYQNKKSNKAKYTGTIMSPVRDCVYNQNDTCTKKDRECSFGPFPGKSDEEIRKQITMRDIKKVWAENKDDYRPCTNCKEYDKSFWGCVWYREVNIGNPLNADEASLKHQEFFMKGNRHFKLSTHANSTLSVTEINNILDIWELEGFIPEVIIIDYADLLVDTTGLKEERHRQNQIWKELRGLSQKRFALVITASQADSDAYKKDTLGLDNYSEDKRKFAHATAWYGLNQDHKGREKALRIMRINELVLRDDDFNIANQVHVLQHLQRGRPFLSSFW